MLSKTQSWAQVIILGATGAYFAANNLNGNITNYIAKKFIWLSWMAAALLLTLAIMRAAALLRGQTHDHAHEGGHHHAHATGWRGWIGLGIVALPVVFGLFVPSQPLDSRAIDGEISGDIGSIGTSQDEMIGIAPQERNVLDWLRAFSVEPDLNAFNGQEADVSGFVYRDARFEGDPARFMVARFVISCCVADAQAIGLVVSWPDGASLPDDSWVRIRGTFEAGEFDGMAPYPVLAAYDGTDGVQPIEQPDHPYLYP
ncbi:MAG: TIGR03943 family protein [Anaerolineae bacterium]|nr:TIGR03943 family protein [Anaerolineae bacterium]